MAALNENNNTKVVKYAPKFIREWRGQGGASGDYSSVCSRSGRMLGRCDLVCMVRACSWLMVDSGNADVPIIDMEPVEIKRRFMRGVLGV